MPALECRSRLRISDLSAVNSHISPKEDEIWGTLVGPDMGHPGVKDKILLDDTRGSWKGHILRDRILG
jgi:hypothetical protein